MPSLWRAAELWPAVAGSVRQWLADGGLLARDCVLLLPFAALLEPARAAFATAGGWQPRIETPLTWAAALGPPAAPEPGACSGDATLDHLAADALLRRQPWGQVWAARDDAGFERAVALFVQAAQALRGAAAARAPEQREAFWAQARDGLPPAGGAGVTESLLLRAALEWASAGAPAQTDRLFDARPAAWIVLRLGGPDPVAEALLGHAGIASLRVVADPDEAEPFQAAAALGEIEAIVCDDFEAEAQASAAAVIEGLNAGRAPVALVALDRALVRRVRALLQRQQVRMVDETGWLLATTPAAAGLVARLRAALPGAGGDDRLAWLKTWPLAAPREIDALEAQWRGRRRFDQAAADRLWQRAAGHLQPLQAGVARPLADWLALLGQQLEADGTLAQMAADAAGEQVLRVLHLAGADDADWRQALAAATQRVELRGLLAWVQATLEHAEFLPPPDADAELVLTPLARAPGRRFGLVVMPGADHRRLGAFEAAPSLIGDTAAAALGIEHAASRRTRQRLALAQLARGQPLRLLRRLRDDDETLAESPDVEWLRLARAAAGLPDWPRRPWQPATLAVVRQPVALPRPTAPQALPATLSASRLEALRACPYRFYARAVLRLEESEELDTGLAKRDYGTWLHAVLYRLHSQGQEGAAALRAAADAVTAEMALDDGELLPFRASFEAFVPAYLKWLAERQAKGWQWADGEKDHELQPPGLPGLSLRGRIDRLDAGPAAARQLIDYKTGGVASLKERVRQPLEDAQLAFYAALLGPSAGELSAAYLALDDADAPLLVPHPDVARSAAVLLEALAGEWQRLRAGAALPALGEGTVCETCEARGLCRRDHWSAV